MPVERPWLGDAEKRPGITGGSGIEAERCFASHPTTAHITCSHSGDLHPDALDISSSSSHHQQQPSPRRSLSSRLHDRNNKGMDCGTEGSFRGGYSAVGACVQNMPHNTVDLLKRGVSNHCGIAVDLALSHFVSTQTHPRIHFLCQYLAG